MFLLLKPTNNNEPHFSLLLVIILFALALSFPLLATGKFFYIFPDYLYLSISVSIVILIFYIFFRSKQHLISANLIDIFVTIYFLYNILNLFILNRNNFSSRYTILVLPFIAYYTFRGIFSIYKNKKLLENHFIFFVILTTCIPLTIGILEYTGIKPLYVTFEITGGFLNPNVFANYLGTLLPFLFSIIFLRITKNIPLKIISGIILIMLITTMIITQCRSSWIASSVSVFYILLHHPHVKDIFRKYTNTLFKKIIIIGFVLLAVFTVLIILYNYKKDSADGRIFIWKICTEIIDKKPVFGQGFDSFTRVFTEQQRTYFELNPSDIKNGMLANDAKFAFNDYLQIIIESGVLGLIVFLCIIFFAIKSNYKKYSWQNSKLLIIANGGIISILICAMFSYPLKCVIHYMLLFVLISYISSRCKTNFKLPKEKKHLSLFLTWLFILTSVSVLIYQVKFFRYSNKWKYALIESQTSNSQNSISTYQEIAPFFNTYFPFLYNYGCTLYNCGRFEESIEILESARKLDETYDLLINMGECYTKLNHLKKAESCYIDASNIIPHKFIPRYKLFKLYQKNSKPQKAFDMAKEINNMRIKVYNPLTGQIKNEVLEYIKNKN